MIPPICVIREICGWLFLFSVLIRGKTAPQSVTTLGDGAAKEKRKAQRLCAFRFAWRLCVEVFRFRRHRINDAATSTRELESPAHKKQTAGLGRGVGWGWPRSHERGYEHAGAGTPDHKAGGRKRAALRGGTPVVGSAWIWFDQVCFWNRRRRWRTRNARPTRPSSEAVPGSGIAVSVIACPPLAMSS